MPVIILKSSPERWVGLPLPAERFSVNWRQYSSDISPTVTSAWSSATGKPGTLLTLAVSLWKRDLAATDMLDVVQCRDVPLRPYRAGIVFERPRHRRECH